MRANDAARRAVNVAVDHLGIRIGEPVRREEILSRFDDRRQGEAALQVAEGMRWISPVGADFVEVTRRGFAARQRR